MGFYKTAQPAPPPCKSPFRFSSEDYLNDWIPQASLDDMSRKHYDVIIVGTGFGGGAVLWRLCERWRKSGKKIAVIEAGNLFLPTHAQNIPTLNGDRRDRFMWNPKFWKFLSGPPDCFNEFFALGGRSMVWGAVSPRMHRLILRYGRSPWRK